MRARQSESWCKHAARLMVSGIIIAVFSGCESKQQQTIGWAGEPVQVEKSAGTSGQIGGGRDAPTGSRTASMSKSKPIEPATSASSNRKAPTKTATPSGKTTGAKPGTKVASGSAALPKELSLSGYGEIASAWNARAARLTRVWGRAVVSIDFKDESGKDRWEQGEGHLQVVQPSQMALSVGKLGEVMLWLGCSGDRYWVIDAKETKRAYVGRHSRATREKIESLGLPAAPRDLLALTGITPLPAAHRDNSRNPSVRSVDGGRKMVFDIERGEAIWRYTVEAKRLEAERIEVLDRSTGETILQATLEKYDQVKIRGTGQIPPRMASRVRCLHIPSGSQMSLSIADMIDGGKDKLQPRVFEFEQLVELLGIKEIVDLDAPQAAVRDADGES